MVKEVTEFPEMTTAERNALTGVPTGTVILNTTTNQFEVWSGAVWTPQTGASGANTALSNLAAVAINTALVPGTSNTINVGSNSFRFANLNLGGEAIVYNGNGDPSVALNANLTIPSGGTGYRGMYVANATGSAEPLAIVTTNQGTADANATGEARIETGNKTAGTGGSGAITLQTGTSSGGTRGIITLNGSAIRNASSIVPTTTGFDLGTSPIPFQNIYNQAILSLGIGIRLFDASLNERSRYTVNNGGTTPSGEATPGTALKAFITSSTTSLRSIYIYTDNDAVVNAVQTGDIRIETGNKTAGTGNSGGIILKTGTSSGGSRGTITLDSATNILVNAAAITIGQFYNGVIKTFDDTASTNMSVRSGVASAGSSGTVSLQSGIATTSSGLVTISSGNAVTSGNINITVGAGSTTRGKINFNGHLRSADTTPPTATVNANAGTGATSAVSSATDTAGILQLVTGSAAWAAGAQTRVNFTQSYATAPIVVLTPRTAAAATSQAVEQVYVTSTTTDFTVNFVNAAAAANTLEWFYHIIETS